LRAVVQRVSNSSVSVEGSVKGSIEKGLTVLLGVEQSDTMDDLEYIVSKVVNLRIFSDDNDKMNLSLLDINGELLVISQFTLYGDCRKGRRPSFTLAANPEKGQNYYEIFIEKCKKFNLKKVESGVFGAHMNVEIINDGPVTMLLDSKKIF
jgi:D-tyrosyl-tRNA(Tyr) deacylase